MTEKQIVDVVVRSLSPYLGPSMAEASTRMHCERLGLGDTVTDADVAALLSRLESGLHVFLGREKTDRALDEIRTTVKGMA